MTDILSMVLLAFLASVGLLALIFCIMGSICSEKNESTYILIPASDKTSDLEIKIKYARFKLKFLPGREEKHIIILDNGLDEFLLEIAKREAESDSKIMILKPDELKNL